MVYKKIKLDYLLIIKKKMMINPGSIVNMIEWDLYNH